MTAGATFHPFFYEIYEKYKTTIVTCRFCLHMCSVIISIDDFENMRLPVCPLGLEPEWELRYTLPNQVKIFFNSLYGRYCRLGDIPPEIIEKIEEDNNE